MNRNHKYRNYKLTSTKVSNYNMDFLEKFEQLLTIIIAPLLVVKVIMVVLQIL